MYGYYHPEKSHIYWTLDSQGSPLTFSIHIGQRREQEGHPLKSFLLLCFLFHLLGRPAHSSSAPFQQRVQLEVWRWVLRGLPSRRDAIFGISCLSRCSSARVIGQSPLALAFFLAGHKIENQIQNVWRNLKKVGDV